MKSIRDFDDATQELDFIIKPRHALHCKRKDAENCVTARAVNSLPNVQACKVFQTITYILFKGKTKPTRYQNSAEVIYFAALNDKGGRKAIIDEIRDEIKINGAIRVKLLVPSYARSKGYLRSATMTATRRRAAVRRKAKGFSRTYKKPHTEGMRSGSGQAHSWG